MCGIAGYADVRPVRHEDGDRILDRMCNAILHRGPDDGGSYQHGGVGLGMRRLSIIDIEGGHQPMITPDGRYALVYNGETYNHRELRGRLEQKGVRFRTRCDSEVVLNAFADSGTDAFSGFSGMYAFAVYDRLEGKLVLCRDPLGVKPLYYSYRPGHPFVFASELKALVLHPSVSRDLNLAAVWDYLTYEYVPGPQTILKHVYRLPPGCCLTWKDGQIETRMYRDLPLEQDGVLTPAQSPGAFGTLFESVVAEQMVADVPVGIFLSGGLDSSAVAAAAVHTPGGSNVKTFCVGFEEPTLTDEAVQARETSAFLGTEHHELITNCNAYLQAVPDCIFAMDEPNADMAAVGKYFACKLAASQVKVVLSGEGGDEMLCGYRMHEAMARFEQLRRLQRLPRSVFRDIPASLLELGGLQSAGARWRRLFIPLQDRCAETLPSMTRRYTEAEKTALFQEIPEDARDSLEVLRALFVKARSLEPLTQMQYAWSKQWLAEHLLMQADRLSMRVSLELRVPLLDPRIADFMFRLPDAHKIRKIDGRYRSKFLLRAYLDGKVPEGVLNRPKRGFQIPNVRFVRQDLRRDIESLLCAPDCRIAGFLRPDAIRHRLRLVDQQGDELTCQKLWSLYVLELWCRQGLQA